MKQKLTLLILALFTAMGVWADETWASSVAVEDINNHFSTVYYLRLTSPEVQDVFFNTFELTHRASGNADDDATTYLAFTYNKFDTQNNHNANEFIAISSTSISGHSTTTAQTVSYVFPDQVRLNGNETVYACFVSKNVDGTYNLQKRGLGLNTNNAGPIVVCAGNSYTTSEGTYSFQCHYSCTYTTDYDFPQATEDNYHIWSGINYGDKSSGGKIVIYFMKYTAPGTSGKIMQFDQFSLSLRDEYVSANTYLLFSKNCITAPGVTASTEFEPSIFAAVSTNKVPRANYGKVFTFTFDEDSYLLCGETYYVYMGTKQENGNFCLNSYGLFIKTDASDSGFEINASNSIESNTSQKKDAWLPIYYSSRCKFIDFFNVYANVFTWAGSTLGKYSNPSYSSSDVVTALSEANSNFEASNSRVMSSYRTLNDIVDGWSLNMPSAPCFIRIQSTQGENAYLKAVDSGILKFSTTKDKETIFLLTADGKLISYTKGLRCKDVKYVAAYNETPDYCTYAIEEAVSGAVGKYSVTSMYPYGSVQKHYLYSTGNNDTNADRNTNNSDHYAKNTFSLEEVPSLPVTITGVGLATLYSPVALTIPTDVTAYVASDEGTYLQLTAIDGGVIPANTGVILAGDEGTYNFEITTGGSASSALTGTDAAIARPSDSYIFASGSKGLGFYKDGPDVIPGFKAYLPAGTSVKGFVGFEFDDATGINSLTPALSEGEGAIYNVAGQRISKMQKGINIVNGKKILK